MSADNKIVVKENAHGHYHVTEEFDEGGVISVVGEFKTLREAMLEAEKYEQENAPVEYGIHFVPFLRESLL